jgi:hypothetical protein
MTGQKNPLLRGDNFFQALEGLGFLCLERESPGFRLSKGLLDSVFRWKLDSVQLSLDSDTVIIRGMKAAGFLKTEDFHSLGESP